jgi:hypothetical protein
MSPSLALPQSLEGDVYAARSWATPYSTSVRIKFRFRLCSTSLNHNSRSQTSPLTHRSRNCQPEACKTNVEVCETMCSNDAPGTYLAQRMFNGSSSQCRSSICSANSCASSRSSCTTWLSTRSTKWSLHFSRDSEESSDRRCSANPPSVATSSVVNLEQFIERDGRFGKRRV